MEKIPDEEKENLITIALARPEETPRQLARHITDQYGYYISEFSVYRILKSYDLVPIPKYMVMSASDKFKQPTKRVNELWQTDFTYFKIVGWGWYFLSNILYDYSRYIITWKLYISMTAGDVKDLLDKAISLTGVKEVPVRHKPRFLSDNDPCYLSGELRDYLKQHEMKHTRGAPYHPMTQGKID